MHVTAQTNNAILAETASANTAQNTISSINRAPEGTGVRAELLSFYRIWKRSVGCIGG